jgi:hypothetical protein
VRSTRTCTEPCGTISFPASLHGVDRGGVTGHLPSGVQPHWLPYVHVEDPDATIARARKVGATIAVGPEDIPGIGRFAVLQDPMVARRDQSPVSKMNSTRWIGRVRPSAAVTTPDISPPNLLLSWWVIVIVNAPGLPLYVVPLPSL